MALHWPIILAAGLGAFVEFVEALSIVLAVGTARSWRAAISGAIAAVIVLALLVLLFGKGLLALEGAWFEVIIGTLLLLFGLRWLRKAILRAGGVIKMHDEGEIYKKEVTRLASQRAVQGFDIGAFLISFNGVFIEGVEVIFIVLAVGGAQKDLFQASIGAAIAAVLVLCLGLIARKPLTRVPENTLKFIVACLVSSFGTFWIGEGLDVHWTGGDLNLVYLAVFYFVIGIIGVQIVKSLQSGSAKSHQELQGGNA